MGKKKAVDKADEFPRTIDAAVDLVISRLSPEMKEWMEKFDDEEKLYLGLVRGIGPSMSVRAMLGLWGKNQRLLSQVPGSQHPDDASMYFLIEAWRRLREGPPKRKSPAGKKSPKKAKKKRKSSPLRKRPKRRFR